jgi:RNA polymerase sigma factor (sigma-70 family)
MAWRHEMKYDFSSGRDELRGRFTRFMEVSVRNARKDYLRKLSRYPETSSLESVPEEILTVRDSIEIGRKDAFDFEEERLAKAFSQLPLMRQRILVLLFVEELSPTEIARKLNCSVQHVYNQRSLALKKLRQLLEKEGGKG